MRFASANVQTKILTFTEIVNLIIATKETYDKSNIYLFY